MPPIRFTDTDEGHALLDEIDATERAGRRPRHNGRRRTDGDEPLASGAWQAVAPASRRRRADGQESFKCGQCRAFVGPTISGGRHRNHCPLCLVSRHVDDRRPGDRASDCRSLMSPVGTFFRPNGEQVVLHQCRGCGLERHNRIAADDNPLSLLRLPLVPPRLGRRLVVETEPEANDADATATG